MNDETVGPTYLYKDGEAQIFEGDEVAQKMAEGWHDHPYYDQPSDPTISEVPEAPPAPDDTGDDTEPPAES